MPACVKDVPARHILCFMFFTGFIVVFLLRVNINLAIVGMVKYNTLNLPAVNVQNETYYLKNINSTIEDEITDNVTYNYDDDSLEDTGEFYWDEFQQSLILGAFFWGYMLSQVLGGRLAEIYGTRLVFGVAVLINGALCLAVPVCARLHWMVLFGNRVLLGLAQGVMYPALSVSIVKWVPISERSKFSSITVQGCSLGPVIAMPLCGWILTTWGWPCVFYVCGVITCLWCLAWFYLVYDSPEEHPRISRKEEQFLKKSLKKVDPSEKPPFPWKHVASSLQFWVGVVANFGNDWGFHTFYTFAPKYMKSALGFDVEKSALLSSLPFLCQYLSATVLGVLADYLVQRGVTLRYIRKGSMIISHWMPGILVIVLTFCSHDVVLSVVVLTAAVTMLGGLTTGYYQNPLDIAPNFAGTLTGIANTFGALSGLLSAPVAGAALQNFGSPGGWNVIFYITATIYGVSSLPFLFIARSEELEWNTYGSKAPAELEPFDDKEKNSVHKPIPSEKTTWSPNIQENPS